MCDGCEVKTDRPEPEWSEGRQFYEDGGRCSCHINPPCGFCTGLDEEESDIRWSDGAEALLDLWRKRDAAAEDAEEPAPKRKPKPARTCETPDCGRNSGDARFCRTCRAQAPVRAELARLTEAHTKIGNDWHRATACIDATHVILDDAGIDRAHHLGGGLSLEGRVEALVRNRDVWIALSKEDDGRIAALREDLAALGVSHDAWEVAANAAKAQRDDEQRRAEKLTADTQRMTAELHALRGTLAERTSERDNARSHVASLTEQSDNDLESIGMLADIVDALHPDAPDWCAENGYGDPVAGVKALIQQRDTATDVSAELGHRLDRLRTRLGLAWVVAGVLALGLVAAGVL